MPRHTRTRRHALATVSTLIAALVAVAGLALVGPSAPSLASPVDAAEPIVFEGPLTLTSVEGDTLPLTARLTVDCASDPCTAIVIIVSGDYVSSPTNDQSIPLIDGAASADLPFYGDLCALRFVGAGSVAIGISGDQATVTRNSAAAAANCPDSAEATASAATITGTLTRVSGLSCLIDGTCPTPTPTPTPSPLETLTAGESTGGGAGSARSAADPGLLSTLRPTGEVLTATNLLWAGTGAAVLAILIAFPAVLLDSTSERISERIERRRLARAGAPAGSAARPPLTLLGWPAAAGGLIVAAAASTIVDPDFALDVVGLRTAIGILAGFLTVIGLGWAVVALTLRRTHPQSAPRIEFRLLTLVFVALAVAASLLSGFEPGIIFGFIAGVGFGAAISARARAGAAVLMTVYMIVIAAAAWVGYSLLGPVVGPDPGLLELIALESLSGIAIAGIAALPLALLPLRGLSGQSIWAFSRTLWLLLYAISVGGFLLVLIPLPDSWQLVELDLVAWTIGYAVYLGVAVVAWLVAARPWVRDAPAAEQPLEARSSAEPADH